MIFIGVGSVSRSVNQTCSFSFSDQKNESKRAGFADNDASLSVGAASF
jgi:hypothetical protein